MTDVKTFVELNIVEILKAIELFWDGFSFVDVTGEVMTKDFDYIKTTTIVGIAMYAREMHDNMHPTADQIVEYLVEG